MKKLMTVASVRFVLGICFIFLLFVFGNIPAVKAENNLSLEGMWVVQSSNVAGHIGNRKLIERNGDGYDVSEDSTNSGGHSSSDMTLYYGTPTQIMRTITPTLETLLYEFKCSESDTAPCKAISNLAGKATRRERYTLSSDGLSAIEEADQIYYDYGTVSGRLLNYGSDPWYFKQTLVRIPKSPPPVPNTAVSVPSTQEILVQQRQKEAHDLNEQGVQYYNNKQWKLAADAFKAAMDKNPDDQIVRRNYEHALKAAAAVPSTGENTKTAPSSGADRCFPWEQKYDKDNNPTGIWWRECVPPDGRQYCEECKASPPGCDLNQRGCNPTSCSGHIKCN
jgi:hypothetical protein